jgi:hypothetical protein
METKTAIQIATEVGAPTVNLLGTQDWSPPMHPGIVVSMLHYSDATPMVAFRVRNTKSGEIASKLSGEVAQVGTQVDDAFSDAVALEQYKNLTALPAVYSAIPDLDPGSATTVRGLTVGGQEMIGDVVGGVIKNIRAPSIGPVFSIAADGKLTIDTSPMSQANAALVANAVRVIPPSPAARLGLLRKS